MKMNDIVAAGGQRKNGEKGVAESVGSLNGKLGQHFQAHAEVPRLALLPAIPA